MPDIFITLYDVFMRTYEGFLKAALITLATNSNRCRDRYRIWYYLCFNENLEI